MTTNNHIHIQFTSNHPLEDANGCRKIWPPRGKFRCALCRVCTCTRARASTLVSTQACLLTPRKPLTRSSRSPACASVHSCARTGGEAIVGNRDTPGWRERQSQCFMVKMRVRLRLGVGLEKTKLGKVLSAKEVTFDAHLNKCAFYKQVSH